MTPSRRQAGFTLVELIMVITLMGVIGVMVAVFMRGPINAYFDTGRRAALTDAADTAVRRMARDLRLALPNSIRTPNSQCVELIPTKTGGRYREQDLSPGDGTALNFAVADSSFNMLGDNNAATIPADQKIMSGDVIAIYNLGPGINDAYNQDNTAAVNATPTVSLTPPETTIPIVSTTFPLESASKRFHVVPGGSRVIAYVCSGGKLHRSVSAAFYLASAAGVCPVSGPVLAQHVSLCNFDYSGSDLLRNGLVRLKIALTDQGESVSLYHEVHVNNTP